MVIKINGADIPDPAGFQWDLSDISSSNSGRNAAGAMLTDRIAQKVKLDLTWNFLTFDEVKTILQAIDPPEKDTNTLSLILDTITKLPIPSNVIYFNVTYPDPWYNDMITKIFYVSDRSAPMYSICEGIEGWKSLSMSLLEK